MRILQACLKGIEWDSGVMITVPYLVIVAFGTGLAPHFVEIVSIRFVEIIK